MTNKEIIDALADYNYRACDGETIEECPLNITSRTDIEGEDAELVRFTFGKEEESCVAIFFNDGTFFTPYDWQSPEWDEEGWKIEDTDWLDYRMMEAVVLNGMPRMFS